MKVGKTSSTVKLKGWTWWGTNYLHCHHQIRRGSNFPQNPGTCHTGTFNANEWTQNQVNQAKTGTPEVIVEMCPVSCWSESISKILSRVIACVCSLIFPQEYVWEGGSPESGCGTTSHEHWSLPFQISWFCYSGNFLIQGMPQMKNALRNQLMMSFGTLLLGWMCHAMQNARNASIFHPENWPLCCTFRF